MAAKAAVKYIEEEKAKDINISDKQCEKFKEMIFKPLENYIPKDNNIRTDFDHRIAMSFAVMGSKIGNLKINDSNSINTSFPKFIEKFNQSGGNIL